MRPIREGRLRRLKREADINAQFERDMRETDQQPAPFSKGE